MRYYKITVAYDGTDSHGWQSQPNVPTITSTLEKAFYEVFYKNITLLGASRTDAGVHALGQVATFLTDFNCSAQALQAAWNRRLPPSVVIRSLEEVPSSFYPHKNVDYKIYWYHFFTQRPLPFYGRYGWYLEKAIDFEKLQHCLQVFVGTQDFRSFCTGDEQESTIRTIYAITVRFLPHFKAYRIEIKGNSFLRYMIRRIVGACLYAATSREVNADTLKKALNERNPLQTLSTAPAQGLLLRKIVYTNKEASFQQL